LNAETTESLQHFPDS